MKTVKTKKHPRDLTDEESAALVADFDAAFDDGRTTVVYSMTLSELRSAAAARREAESRIEAAVLGAHREGASWGIIGAQLGMTRQRARQRFERLVHR